MKLLAALLVLLVPGMAAGQSTSSALTGSVVDAVGTPIQGVTISLAGETQPRSAVTDQTGRFRIEGLPPGTYEARASGEGLRASIRVVTLMPGTALTVDFELQPAFAQRVQVTASRGPQTLLAAPSSVSVIGSQELATSAADSIGDVLRGVPGLNVVQFGARDVEVNSRSSTGILSNSTLVMVDGRSFFQPLYGAVYWDLMTVGKDEIGQIEVLRTPASALWGANALNGVINVLTKSPRQMKGLHGQFGFGERGTKSFGATWADASDRMSYKVSASYFEQDPWERDDRLPDGSPMPPFARFSNRGTKQPKVDVRVDWDADRSRVWSLRGGMAGANGLIHSALGPVEFESGSYYSYLELDHRRDDLDFKVYWNRLDSPFRLVLFGLDENSTNDTFVTELSRRLTVGKRNTLTVGGSVRADRFDITVAPADKGRLEAAAFVENRTVVNPTLSVVAGGRLDKFDTTSAVFAPRIGAVISPVAAHSFRATYNRAYRAPSLLENFVDVTLPAVVPTDPPFVYFQQSLGSTELKMERQDAFEIGYTGALASRIVVFVTAYHQSIKNNVWFLPVSFYGPGAPPPGWPGDPALVPLLPHVFSFVNLGRVRDRGIELEARAEWAQLSLQGAYTFRDIPLLESGTTLPLQINRPARHQANGSLSYIGTRWTAGADVHYTGRTFWADVLTEPFWGYVDSYVGVNARASYKPRAMSWELWVAATDLFDAKIKGHVFGDIVRRKVTSGIRWHWP
jgi:iron complex outermembrane receptor protein